MAQIYYDKDVDESVLKGKTVAFIGYGSQGRAQALNLRDSGVSVVIGLRKGPSWERAQADGFTVLSVEEAVKKGDIICMLIPDMAQKKVFEEQVKPYLALGKTLYFSHGLNITFKLIKPPKNIDVIMVAPKGPGPKLRETYVQGFGTPALVAVYQDVSGKAKHTALALAKAMHFTKAGVFECSFDDETITDLFGEQVVLCGGLTELIKKGFETLVEAGYPPEIAYFETVHEVKLIVDLIVEGGLEHMWSTVSETARYGGRTRGPRIISERTKKEMKKILRDIQKGKFTKEWSAEYAAGMPTLKRLHEQGQKEQIEIVGARIRGMFQKP